MIYNVYHIILKHYYITIIRIILTIIFPIISQQIFFPLLYHCYNTIILIIFTIISDYIRVLRPNFQQLAAASGTRY